MHCVGSNSLCSVCVRRCFGAIWSFGINRQLITISRKTYLCVHLPAHMHAKCSY